MGMVVSEPAFRFEGGVNIDQAAGHIADLLAAAYDKLYLCSPPADRPLQAPTTCTLRSENIELIPTPPYASSMAALRHPVGIIRAYVRLCRRVDVLFVRGMVPYVAFLYVIAALTGCRTCHWIIGNNLGLLRTHRRAGRIMDAMSIAYAWQDRICTRLGRWLTQGSFVCNGQELGDIYRSPRTVVTASSTVRDDEFFWREDTCTEEKTRILFVGAIRPEKGVEYLLEAVARLEIQRPWELIIVGPWEKFPDYRKNLDRIVERLGIGERVQWMGYVPYGPELFRCMREADLFVLPTLSEGTPHVLVEARASSLPIVATRVGGIPTTVTDGVDALLVPPKDPQGLARGITRIVSDGELRRSLIRQGFRTARDLTIDRFVDLVRQSMEDP